MTPKIPIAAITDEFSPDLETALTAMQEIGMTGAELRVVSGKNIMDLSDEELDRVDALVEARGFQVISIASPLFKCVLPGSPPVDDRFQQDVFAAKYTFEDQPRLAERAFFIANKFRAKIVRVFSFWRTVQPEACFESVVRELGQLAEKAARQGLTIGLENEHACNIATGAETRRVLDRLQHPNLGVVWDPANAYVSGENPFPSGYGLLPAERIVHVHAKDCHMEGHQADLGSAGHTWSGLERTDRRFTEGRLPGLLEFGNALGGTGRR